MSMISKNTTSKYVIENRNLNTSEFVEESKTDPWNRSPKTDYTYAESIIYNRNRNENFDHYPNMSRMSMHNNGTDRYNLRSGSSIAPSSTIDITPSIRKRTTPVSKNVSNKNDFTNSNENRLDNDKIMSVTNIITSHTNITTGYAMHDNVITSREQENGDRVTRTTRSSSNITNSQSSGDNSNNNSFTLNLKENMMQNNLSNSIMQSGMSKTNLLESTMHQNTFSNLNDLKKYSSEVNIVENNDDNSFIQTISTTILNFVSSIGDGFSYVRKFLKSGINRDIDVTKRRKVAYSNENHQNKRKRSSPLLLLVIMTFLFLGWLLWSLLSALLSAVSAPVTIIPSSIVLPVNETDVYANYQNTNPIDELRKEFQETTRQIVKEELKLHTDITHHLLELQLQDFDNQIARMQMSNTRFEEGVEAHIDNLSKKLNVLQLKSHLMEELNEFVTALTDDGTYPQVGSHAHLVRDWFVVKMDHLRKNFSSVVEEIQYKLSTDFDAKIAHKLKIMLDEFNKSFALPVALTTQPQVSSECVACDGYSTILEVKDLIKSGLSTYDADKTGKPDYALESAGGVIITTRCTETYKDRPSVYSIFGLPIYYHVNGPRTIIQPGNNAGDCWAFAGSHGNVVIKLSQDIFINQISIEHLSKNLMPHGVISSAPKDYIVKGLASETDENGAILGSCIYDQNGSTIQECSLNAGTSSFFRYIEIEFTSNHGNPDFTCIYRVRVHGSSV